MGTGPGRNMGLMDSPSSSLLLFLMGCSYGLSMGQQLGPHIRPATGFNSSSFPKTCFCNNQRTGVGLAKFDPIREHDSNPTRFLWVLVEYNRVWIIFVLTRLTRLINRVIFVLICLTRI